VERTDIRFFVPYGPEGLNPTLTVTEEISGSVLGELAR
jgi:hypothetical protein